MAEPLPFPQAPIPQSGYEPDAATPKTLTLVAIILQIVFFVVGTLVLERWQNFW